MKIINKPTFNNRDLDFDLEKLLTNHIDNGIEVTKGSFTEDGGDTVWVIDINAADSSYFYVNKKERNEDIKNLWKVMAEIENQVIL